MSLDDRCRQGTYFKCRREQVEVMNSIAKAILIPMHRRRLTDAKVEGLATLVGIADGFDAQFRHPLRHRLGVLQTGFMLDFDNHRNQFTRVYCSCMARLTCWSFCNKPTMKAWKSP